MTLRELSTVDVFTALGFPYPVLVDGHDVIALEQPFQDATALGRPVVVHRKGDPPTEGDGAGRPHATGPSPSATPPLAVPPDHAGPTRRYLPGGAVRGAGVRRRHAATSAAGMAMGGRHPVVATFLNGKEDGT
jgi:1-deoxy-D-xylulose-5-phosphate synthase